jgi:hypothetical protein
LKRHLKPYFQFSIFPAPDHSLFEDYKNDGAQMLAFVFKYGNKEMVRQMADGVQGRG